jgi:membrane-associated phospholipid phosphatase
MEVLLPWGIDLIVAIQQIHGPVLDGIFRTITFIGGEEFYLFLLPLLFWCVDFGLGARLAVLFLLSSYLNTDLKDLFQQPRPFDLNPSVQLSLAEGYGLPSGHAQSAVVVWGSIAAWSRKGWFWGTAIGLMVLIGFSRIYLGVHFPTDVLAGWAIGAVLLGLYLAVQPRAEKWLTRLSLGQQILLALALPLLLLLIHPVKDTTAAMATLAGMGVGLALKHRYLPFTARGPCWQRTLRFLTGGVIVIALYLGLKLLFPGDESALYLVFRFLRYGFIGVWVSLGAPWFFRLVRLAPEAERGI